MKKKFIAYHGDVDLFEIDRLPKGAKLISKTKRHIAQYGETTGHKHAITSKAEFEVYEIERKDERGELIKYLVYRLTEPAEIAHEEHRTHDLQPGIYFQDQETEESPQDGTVRRVID
jgi:hypothetical protein